MSVKVPNFASKTAIAWCFGYGSLVHSYSHKAKYVEVDIEYRRVWNAWNTKARATFLGLEPYKKKTSINGVIYPIFSQEELDELDMREQGYTKKVIDHGDAKIINEGLNEVMRGMKLEPQMLLFTYVPEESGNAPNAMFPIVQSYVDLCAGGFLMFRVEGNPRDENDPVRRFLDTTYGWSEYMLNDRILARRPWKYESNHFIIDDYLDDEDDVHDIPAALYPEEYSVKYSDELKKCLLERGTSRLKYVEGY